MFNPSQVLQNKGGEKINRRISKYIEKFANGGISKTTKQEITKTNSKRLKSKETDRFFKKLFRKKFNTPMSNKKEKIIINTQNGILDATGLLAILWQEAEKLKSANKDIDPNDVINIVQRALVLIGNAHYIYMSDRRKTLLSKLLPESVDLIDDSSGKKKPYVNQRTNSLEINLENYSLRTARITENCLNFFQQENVLHLTNIHLIRKTFLDLVTNLSSFFRTGPSKNRFQFGGHNYRGQFSQRGRGYRGAPRSATITRKTKNQ